MIFGRLACGNVGGLVESTSSGATFSWGYCACQLLGDSESGDIGGSPVAVLVLQKNSCKWPGKHSRCLSSKPQRALVVTQGCKSGSVIAIPWYRVESRAGTEHNKNTNHNTTSATVNEALTDL